MIVDANLLLYAVDLHSPYYPQANRWLNDGFAGSRLLSFPWQTLTAFLRIATSPRVFTEPMEPMQAWSLVQRWLSLDIVWVPTPGHRYPEILAGLIRDHDVRGNVVMDAALAALAIEHGLTIYSADTDFARFREVRWVNPLDA